jgi:tetraacyldisaccharide 4'-kinase
MVLWLVEQLAARGYRTGVLLRGYRRVSPERRTVAHPRVEVSPLRSGDEAQILLRHFRELGLEVPIGIGSDRYMVGSRIEQEQTLDVLILDDGFQHFQLERQFDLVLVDAMRPLGGGLPLPLGRLREPVSGVGRAAAVILTRTEPGRLYKGLEDRLRSHNADAPIFRSHTQIGGAVEAATGQDIPLESLRTKRLLALCGVGNPAFFWRCLEEQGLQVAHRMRFRDHHRYAPGDLRNILLAARQEQAEAVVTTEKDLVNLWHAADSAHSSSTNLEATVAELFHPLPVYWIRIAPVIENGEQLIEFIENRIAPQRSPHPAPAVVREPR